MPVYLRWKASTTQGIRPTTHESGTSKEESLGVSKSLTMDRLDTLCTMFPWPSIIYILQKYTPFDPFHRKCKWKWWNCPSIPDGLPRGDRVHLSIDHCTSSQSLLGMWLTSQHRNDPSSMVPTGNLQSVSASADSLLSNWAHQPFHLITLNPFLWPTCPACIPWTTGTSILTQLLSQYWLCYRIKWTMTNKQG